MVGGIDKYFQIAPCFRDEDPRADRHSCEFYQIDVEMSFVEQEDVFKIAEEYVKDLIPTLSPHKHIKGNTVYRLTHKEAMDTYGSDKPDIRFDMKFVDLTKDFANSEFSVFRDAVASGGTVKAMKLSGKVMSRSEIDELTEVAKSAGAKGLAYIIYEAE
jgi:aspartyl-tRNA synthetase